MITYTTKQGETFDKIARDQYGEGGEIYVSDIISANKQYCDVVFFEAGVVLTIPAKTVSTAALSAPWKN